MGEIADKIKGKAKQIGGIITDDDALVRDGRKDEATGKAKGVVNKVENALHHAVDTVKQAVKKI